MLQHQLLAWELLGGMVMDLGWAATAPVRRPIWRAFVTASWPWPLILMMAGGAASAWFGLQELRPELAAWRNGVGMVAFFAGCAIALSAPFLWRDARREANRGLVHDQPSNDR